MTVKKLVLKTVPGVTQMVLTQMVGWAGCTEAGGKMVSHSVGEMDDTSAKTVTVDSLVIVKVDVATWLSVLCWLNASKVGAGVLVICCTRSCEAQPDWQRVSNAMEALWPTCKNFAHLWGSRP